MTERARGAGIVFDRALYRPAAVHEAARAFAEVGDVEVIELKRETRVRLRTIDPASRERVEGEFANYVLGLAAKARRRTKI